MLKVKWQGPTTLSWGGRRGINTIGLNLRDVSKDFDVELRPINSRGDLSYNIGIRIPRDANTLNQIGDMFKDLAKNV